MRFGVETSPCSPTVLANELDDPVRLTQGIDCVLGEFDAGRRVVWDVLLLTVEGDPIVLRYDYDGETVTITEDPTRDEFGSARAVVRRCHGLEASPGGALPSGVDCTSSGGDGFATDGLPIP